MEKLTTNKEVSEMNMIELAHNSCYGKDGKARYRDYETDIDARELAIKLLEKHADIPNEFTCDDDFDDFIADSLQYGTDDMLGLIAVFYRNLCAMANLRGRLKEYEDLEEQGHLIRIPCKIGDTIYVIPSEANYKINIVNRHGERNRVYKQVVSDVGPSRTGYIIYTCENQSIQLEEMYQETWFLTEEEAETALRKMEDKNETD